MIRSVSPGCVAGLSAGGSGGCGADGRVRGKSGVSSHSMSTTPDPEMLFTIRVFGEEGGSAPWALAMR